MCVWVRGKAYTEFGWGNLRERPHGRPRLRWEIILRWIFRKWEVRV